MKQLLAFLMFVFIVFMHNNSSAQTKQDSITGAWRLIFSKGSINNISFDKDSTTVDMFKVFSGSIFINTVYTKKTNRFQSTVQGTFSAKDSTYSETILHSSVGDFPGHSFNYTYSLAGNILIIRGESNGIKLLERWKKIE